MPSGAFAHVCLVVESLERAIEDWSRILGVLDPGQLKEPLVRYEEFSGGADSGMRWATFVSQQGCEIQLIEPAPDTPLGRRLAKVGEHVHHLCFTTPDVAAALNRLSEQGVELASAGEVFSDPAMPWQRWGWVSHRSAHGVLVEVAAPYESHRDGRWHPARETDPASRELP